MESGSESESCGVTASSFRYGTYGSGRSDVGGRGNGAILEGGEITGLEEDDAGEAAGYSAVPEGNMDATVSAVLSCSQSLMA